MYSTSDDVAGPWTDLIPVPTEPESDDSFNNQHDFVVKVSGTEDTTYVYVGDRYSQHHGVGEGRNIFLPLIWKKGVPTLLWRENWKVDVSTGRHSLVR